jgi:hypothetical protein
MAAKKKSAREDAKPKVEPVLTDWRAAPHGSQLRSDAFFGDSSGGIWVHSRYAGSNYTYRMPGVTEVLEVSHGEMQASWTSPNGTTYLVSDDTRPFLRFTEGRFDVLDVETPVAGAAIEGCDDRLAIAVRASHVSYPGRQTELWYGTPSALRKIKLDIVGDPVGVVFDADGKDIWIGVKSQFMKAPGIFRVTGGVASRVALPPGTDEQSDVNGLGRTGDGDLLVLIGVLGNRDAPAEPWLRRRDGGWEKVTAPEPLVGWLGRLSLRSHRSRVYIPTVNGVFSYEPGTLRKESSFYARSLWPCGAALVACGYRQGRAAHEIERDGEWRPFSVPEPDVVSGGRGKVVYLTGRNVLPLRRVRLPLAKFSGKKAPSPAVPWIAPAFSYAEFLERLASDKETQRRPRALDVVARVEADAGHAIAPALRRYLEVAGARELGVTRNAWHHMDPASPDFVDTTDLEQFVRAFQFDANPTALLTDTRIIGQDGSGNSYAVEVAPDSSRVFFYDHDEPGLRLLADSFESFAEMNDVAASWARLEEAEGFDIDDFEAKSPAVRAIQARAKALAGRVSALGDYEHTLNVLAGRKLSLGQSHVIVELSDLRGWLALWFLVEKGSRDQARRQLLAEEKLGDEAKRRPSTEICRLLSQFMLGDKALEGTLERAARHRAGLVRAVAELVANAQSPSMASAPVRWFAGLAKAIED